MAELVALVDIDFTDRVAILRKRLEEHKKKIEELDKNKYIPQ